MLVGISLLLLSAGALAICSALTGLPVGFAAGVTADRIRRDGRRRAGLGRRARRRERPAARVSPPAAC